MAKNIQFEQENNEGFEEGKVAEMGKESKKENPVTKKWNGLKTWQKVVIGGTVIGGLAALVVKKVFFHSAPAATDVVKDVVETTTEAVSEAAPF